eukprot:scaffold2205_cov66-Phaeocystis_antarctica.AAC.1
MYTYSVYLPQHSPPPPPPSPSPPPKLAPPPLLVKTQQQPPPNPTGTAAACLECSVEARHLTRPKVVRGIACCALSH